MGRKAPHCFRHFRGRGRMLQPGKAGTKSELSAGLSLRRGWPPAVLQSSRHWRHFQPKAGLCLSSPCDAPHVMPHGDCSRGRKKLHCAIALWAQGIQSPRQLLGAATSTSTDSQSRPVLLFQPQARFDERDCKGSSYGFVLGLCQLSADPHARTIIISFTDLLWQ